MGIKIANNVLSAIQEFKQLENEKKIMLEIVKDKWHPLPIVSYQEVIFEKHSQISEEKVVHLCDNS